MRPTISQLRAWDPEQLRTASSSLARRVDEFGDLMDGVTRASAAVAQTWRGSASSRAQRRIELEARAGVRVAAAGLVLVQALNRGVMAIDVPRRLALDAAAAIEMLGGRIGDDGAVVTADRLAALATAELAEQVRAGLDQVDAADRSLAGALVDALAGLVRAAELRPPASQPSGPIPAGTVGLSALWASLADVGKAELLAARPELGLRPGMPAATRDFYNREKLEGLIADASRGPQTAEARTRLAGFEAVAAQLAADPRALLLDVDRRGTAAIALNNPDTATHVATVVPGTGTNLRDMGRDVDRSRRLLEAAEGVSPDNSYSVITWDGYLTPPDIPHALDAGYAERGKGLLREFQSGLAASHEIGDPHSVVIAHSYGTGTAGLAASGGGTLDADALVFLGSPGAIVDNAGELSLTGVAPQDIGEHVYSSRAANDPVPLAANVGGIFDFGIDVLNPALGPLGVPLDLFGDVVADHVSGPFGTDPADAEKFGGRVFTSDPGTAAPGIGWSAGAHSEYFDFVDGTPNQALRNLALIMAGKGDKAS